MSPLAPEEASTQPTARAVTGPPSGDPGGEDAGAEAVVDVDDRDPGAQELSMPRRAATPPNEAP